MLESAIERKRRQAEHDILEYYRRHYHPHTALLPNARFGLYAAAKELLSPGDQVIISPITCRTVIDALLAAGTIPVFVDIESDTGNIDTSRLSRSLLTAARAIVTTNLYGNPDQAPEIKRLAAKHGLLLIEDCAHVIHTMIDGHRIGTVGDVSVFSFKKYFGEPGGVIAFRGEAAARAVEARVAVDAALPPEREERLRFLQLLVERASSPAMAARISRMIPRNGRHANTAVLPAARAARPTLPLTASLARVADCLSHVDLFIAERMRAARELIARCPLPLKRSRWTGDVCYFVVPFFSERRDDMIEALRLRGVAVCFLYTPPMNKVFRGLDRLLDPDAVDLWCRNILPINPRFARECLDVLKD